MVGADVVVAGGAAGRSHGVPTGRSSEENRRAYCPIREPPPAESARRLQAAATLPSGTLEEEPRNCCCCSCRQRRGRSLTEGLLAGGLLLNVQQGSS